MSGPVYVSRVVGPRFGELASGADTPEPAADVVDAGHVTPTRRGAALDI
jgi:hypothetical protein